jgi:hypothetical protein
VKQRNPRNVPPIQSPVYRIANSRILCYNYALSRLTVIIEQFLFVATANNRGVA